MLHAFYMANTHTNPMYVVWANSFMLGEYHDVFQELDFKGIHVFPWVKFDIGPIASLPWRPCLEIAMCMEEQFELPRYLRFGACFLPTRWRS
jgi:hypothetical protein